jgi:hypothetical protein
MILARKLKVRIITGPRMICYLRPTCCSRIIKVLIQFAAESDALAPKANFSGIKFFEWYVGLAAV